jgi:hypothetical protein
MLKLHVHFILMILIFVISILNAFYIIASNSSNWFFKLIAIIIIFIIIYMANFKETFLSFLGPTVYPLGLIPNEMYPPKSNFSIELDFDYPNGTKVIYWSANKDNNKDQIYNNPKDAYGDYKNCGIAVINNKKALLHIHCPNKYKVPMAGTLDKHIHYRIALVDSPILSDVKTTYINC